LRNRNPRTIITSLVIDDKAAKVDKSQSFPEAQHDYTENCSEMHCTINADNATYKLKSKRATVNKKIPTRNTRAYHRQSTTKYDFGKA